jgi:hypothetical protein
MDLTSIPVPAGIRARERCIVRGQRLVQVKFVALPNYEIERQSVQRRHSPVGGNPIFSLLSFMIRAIDRLVAARP